jgi:hypothetical protein
MITNKDISELRHTMKVFLNEEDVSNNLVKKTDNIIKKLNNIENITYNDLINIRVEIDKLHFESNLHHLIRGKALSLISDLKTII